MFLNILPWWQVMPDQLIMHAWHDLRWKRAKYDSFDQVLMCLMYRLDMLTKWKEMKVLLGQVRQDDML